MKNLFKPSTLVIGLCAEALPNQGIASETSLLPVPETDSRKKSLVQFQGVVVDERFAADAFVFPTIRAQFRPSG